MSLDINGESLISLGLEGFAVYGKDIFAGTM